MTTVDEYLSNMDLFKGLSKGELKKIRKLMAPVTIKAGRTMIKEDTPGREAFIILSGRATVRRGGRVVATVGSGDILGEMSVISGMHRTATVTAETDIEAEVLNRREFSSLLDTQPALTKKIMVAVIHRLHELEPTLIG